MRCSYVILLYFIARLTSSVVWADVFDRKHFRIVAVSGKLSKKIEEMYKKGSNDTILDKLSRDRFHKERTKFTKGNDLPHDDEHIANGYIVDQKPRDRDDAIEDKSFQTSNNLTSEESDEITEAISDKPDGSFGDRNDTLVDGNGTLADEYGTLTNGYCAFSDGNDTLADGNGTLAHEYGKLADGNGTLTDGYGKSVDGNGTITDGNGTLADRYNTPADGYGTLLDGYGTLDDEYGILRKSYKIKISGILETDDKIRVKTNSSTIVEKEEKDKKIQTNRTRDENSTFVKMELTSEPVSKEISSGNRSDDNKITPKNSNLDGRMIIKKQLRRRASSTNNGKAIVNDISIESSNAKRDKLVKEDGKATDRSSSEKPKENKRKAKNYRGWMIIYEQIKRKSENDVRILTTTTEAVGSPEVKKTKITNDSANREDGDRNGTRYKNIESDEPIERRTDNVDWNRTEQFLTIEDVQLKKSYAVEERNGTKEEKSTSAVIDDEMKKVVKRRTLDERTANSPESDEIVKSEVVSFDSRLIEIIRDGKINYDKDENRFSNVIRNVKFKRGAEKYFQQKTSESSETKNKSKRALKEINKATKEKASQRVYGKTKEIAVQIGNSLKRAFRAIGEKSKRAYQEVGKKISEI